MRLLQPFLPTQPFTRSNWRLVGLMWGTAIFMGYAVAQAADTLPFARESFGLTEGQMAFVLAVARVGALAALAFSAYSDRRGRRGPFLLALAVLFAATALTGLAVNPRMYAITQAAVRMSATAAAVLAVVLLAEGLRPGNRAYGISLFGAGGSFGAGLALFVLPVARLGPDAWRWLFASGAVGLLLIPFLAGQINESPAFRQPTNRISLFAPLGRHPRSFWILAAISFLAAAFTAVVATFNTERLISDLGFSVVGASAVLLVGGTIGGIGFFTGGRLAEVWGRRPAASLAITLALIGGIGIYQLEHPILLTASAALGAYGTFSAIAPLGAQRTELFPTEMRSNAGLWLNNFGVTGAVIGLALGPLTIDQVGLSTTVTLLGTGMMIAALLVMFLPETRGSRFEYPTATT